MIDAMQFEITPADWLGPYADHADVTPSICWVAYELLTRTNCLLDRAACRGVVLGINPATGSLISGSGNGGFRPANCPIGAANSRHKTGHAVDIYDPARSLARWVIKNIDQLEACGLYIEDPRWTPTWLHLQDEPPVSGRRVFVPSSQPPLAPALGGNG